MNEIGSIERVLRILQILGSGSRISTTQLLRRFDNQVSRRTLQRDLNIILSADIPLRSRKIKGNENEWSLDSTFRSFVPQTLSTNEFLSAHILKENLQIFQNTTFSQEVGSLIRKIEQMVPDNVFIETDRFDSTQMFDNYSNGFFDYSGYSQIIDDIIQAIMHHSRCLINYHNPEKQEQNIFQIDPRKMIHYGGGLYIIAYLQSRKDFRLLALQNIQSLKLTGEIFNETPQFNHKKFMYGKFGLHPGKVFDVELLFDESIKHHLLGRKWHQSQQFEGTKDGDLILKLRVGLTQELVIWILGWRDKVRVQKPNRLISLILDETNLIQRNYTNAN